MSVRDTVTTTVSGSAEEKSVSEKLFEYLEQNPESYDVIFAVGPEKTIVRGLKVVLKAVSSVFESEFRDKWENSVLLDKGSIPLPDLDPQAFQLFIKLTISDTWSVKVLEGLKLSWNGLFNLLTICHRFGMKYALNGVEELVQKFISSFADYQNTDEFQQFSQQNLQSIVSRDEDSSQTIGILAPQTPEVLSPVSTCLNSHLFLTDVDVVVATDDETSVILPVAIESSLRSNSKTENVKQQGSNTTNSKLDNTANEKELPTTTNLPNLDVLITETNKEVYQNWNFRNRIKGRFAEGPSTKNPNAPRKDEKPKPANPRKPAPFTPRQTRSQTHKNKGDESSCDEDDNCQTKNPGPSKKVEN